MTGLHATCAYCGQPFDEKREGRRMTKDHIIPKSFEGPVPRGWGNLVRACSGCNHLKGNMLPPAIRAMATTHRERADMLDAMAARIDALISERGLMPSCIGEPADA